MQCVWGEVEAAYKVGGLGCFHEHFNPLPQWKTPLSPNHTYSLYCTNRIFEICQLRVLGGCIIKVEDCVITSTTFATAYWIGRVFGLSKFWI